MLNLSYPSLWVPTEHRQLASQRVHIVSLVKPALLDVAHHLHQVALVNNSHHRVLAVYQSAAAVYTLYPILNIVVSEHARGITLSNILGSLMALQASSTARSLP